VDTGSNVEDLQAVSQHVLACTEKIAGLELEKRRVDPGSERFRTLSNDIEALAEEIRRVSAAETDLALDLAGVPGLPTIAEADQEP
jgi:hypothetical protein